MITIVVDSNKRKAIQNKQDKYQESTYKSHSRKSSETKMYMYISS